MSRVTTRQHRSEGRPLNTVQFREIPVTEVRLDVNNQAVRYQQLKDHIMDLMNLRIDTNKRCENPTRDIAFSDLSIRLGNVFNCVYMHIYDLSDQLRNAKRSTSQEQEMIRKAESLRQLLTIMAVLIHNETMALYDYPVHLPSL